MTTPTAFSLNFDSAADLDRRDPLAPFRSRFAITEPDLIYMDGNSLGRAPLAALDVLDSAAREQWAGRLVRGWGEGWMDAPNRIGDKIGAVVGAAAGQVVVVDTTSSNLYKLAMAALALRPGRTKIISDPFNFPSDLYILQGCIHTLGGRHALALAPAAGDGCTPDLPALLEMIDADTALVTLSHVVFKSGYLYDMQAVTRRAHEAGALVIWDLSHSAGAVPVRLDECEADFAVGCTYKYLNGGPGAPGYLYARRDLQAQSRSPLQGWFGQRNPFAFDLDYTPAEGIQRFLCSSPPILSMLAVEPGVDLLLEAGMDRLREKSLRQTGYLIALADEKLAPLGFTLGTPRDPALRGSHVSLRHPEGYRINRALIEQMNVIPDFREPDNIRLGVTPLYTTYAEIWETVDRLARVVGERRYEQVSPVRERVT